LSRPARRNVKNKRFSVPGEPLSLLVVSKVIDPETGQELACWYLLSNTSSDVSSAMIALWYYYRWRIENYFKLLKSGGQEMEH
jgi:IS4 transposase